MENFDKFKEDYTYDVVNKKIVDFVEKFKRIDTLQLLKELVIKSFTLSNQKNKFEIENYSLAISYVQSLYAANPVSNEENNININDFIEEIISIMNVCRLSESLEQDNEPLEDFSAWMYEISFGKTYPSLYPTIIYNLLLSQEKLIQDVYNISINDIMNGIEGIFNALYNIVECLKVGKDIDISMFSVQQATNWPELFINDLSYENASCSEYSKRCKFANWLNIQMPTKNKPFIKIGNDSYFFSISVVFDSLYRAIQRAIVSKKKTNINIWQKNQQYASENFSIDLLSSVLPGCKILKNNYYKINKYWLENDGLIIFKDILFVIEVKAGSYTPDSVMINPLSHAESKKILIEKPLFQCERLLNQLSESGEIDIYNEKHEFILKLTKKHFSKLIPITVTLEPIGEILSMCNNKKIDFLPISIYDLLIYCVFFDNEPIFFMHYMLQRIQNVNLKQFLINDELDYLGSYLTNRNYLYRYNHIAEQEGLNPNELGSVFVDNMHDDLDIYFGSGMQVSKPKFNISNTIYTIIKLIEENLNLDNLNLSITLLNQDDMFHKNLEEAINLILKRQNDSPKFSSVTIFLEQDPSFIPIQLFANDGSKIYSTQEKARLYSLATMKIRKIDEIYYLIVNYKNKKPVNVNVGKLTKDDIFKVSSTELNFIENHLAKTSKKLKQNPIKNLTKLGRNEKCPCGSGKKYKQCCLGKE